MTNLIGRIFNSRHNIMEILKTDLRSTVKNPVVIILLIAIIILPSLYGLVNIYACWDPYDNTDHFPFAIANEDKGATYQDVKINAGNDLVMMLKNNTKFEWVFVTSDELRQGVHDGKYYAGLIVPANFSESIVSITTDDPHSADLEYIVNEKYPVASKLSDGAAKEVYNNINAEIVAFINVAAYDKLGELQAGLASGASQMSSGAVLLSSGAGQVANGAGQVADGANQLEAGADQLSDGANQLAGGTHEATVVADNVSVEIHEGTNYVRNQTKNPEINHYMDEIDSTTNNITGGVHQLDNGAQSLAGNSSLLKGGIYQLSEGTLSLAAGAELLANSAASALLMASSSLAGAAGDLASVTGLNDSQVGNYFYAPVHLEKQTEFDSNSFGSQLSAFYIVLSMWIGALITCVILNVGTSIGTKYRPHEMYFGKLILFNIMAILQTTVTLLGAWHLGITIVNPLMFVFTCYFVALIFMAVIYSLVSLFGHVGQGIAIILLVFQISSTGGIYPVEIMNKFFVMIYPYLPMTHAITCVREAQLGLIWSNYLPNFAILLCLGIVMIILAIILKQRFDKRTKYFEGKLNETNLFK